MTDKEKDLLLKDLCGRLPYGVKCEVYGRIGILDEISSYGIAVNYDNGEDTTCRIECVKPYLFPLSSATEEQVNELFSILELDKTLEEDYIKVNEVTGITFLLKNGFDVEEHLEKLMDWLNKYHFDWRGLIEKGLAIDATGLNIYKNKE